MADTRTSASCGFDPIEAASGLILNFLSGAAATVASALDRKRIIRRAELRARAFGVVAADRCDRPHPLA